MAYDRQFAENELERAGFGETEFKDAVLHFLDAASKISNKDPSVIKQLTSVIHALVDHRVLTEITEEDFETETHVEGSRTVEIERCTRYPYLYKQDGRYWDDRAVAFQREDSAPGDRMYVYQSGNSSKQEVELPYFPQERIERL